MLTLLRGKYGDDLLEQSVTVCSGLDMVNITLCHFVFPDKATSEVCAAALIGISNSAASVI